MSGFIERARQQLTNVQARLYVNGVERKALEEEAKGLAAFINLSQQEEAETAAKTKLNSSEFTTIPVKEII